MVQINKYRIPVSNLPAAFHGFTIIHLTDLHYGLLSSSNFMHRVIERANAIPADAIVCTGDYVHRINAGAHIDRIWPLLASLAAPYGVFSVLGNHDHWGDTDRSLYWLDKTGQNIRHRAKCIEIDGERLWLVGAGDLWEDHVSLDRIMSTIPEHECKIVLAHNPDTADTDFAMPINLVVAGHTHGGQLNLPFCGAPMLSVKNRDYSSGLTQSKRGVPVFISRGIGWGVVPIRFKCFPEIAVLELVKTVEESAVASRKFAIFRKAI